MKSLLLYKLSYASSVEGILGFAARFFTLPPEPPSANKIDSGHALP